MSLTNREILLHRLFAAGRQLWPLLGDLTFVGGTTVAVLVDDPNATALRPTVDVDCVVEVTTRQDFYERICEGLRRQGFAEDSSSGVICRWLRRDVILDVMPADSSVLGFASRWYLDVIRFAWKYTLSDIELRIVTASLFIATKLDAYRGRGNDELALSHDIEDIIAVIDGRIGLGEELLAAPAHVRAYLRTEFEGLLNNPDWIACVIGHLGGDAERAHLSVDKMKAFVKSE